MTLFLNNYTSNQTEVPTLPSKESKEIFHFVYCLMVKGVVILTENLAFKPPPAGYQSWSWHQESGSTSSPSLTPPPLDAYMAMRSHSLVS